MFRRFICCTVESDADHSLSVMSNMRQVMNGLKNYLTNTGEGDLIKMISREQNMDMVLEEMMQEMIVKPLSKHLYCLLLQQHGSVMEKMRLKKSSQLVDDLDSQLLSEIQECQQSMRDMFSAVDKMRMLQRMVDLVTSDQGEVVEQCETLTRIMVTTDWSHAAIEVDYVWGLLSPHDLNPR